MITPQSRLSTLLPGLEVRITAIHADSDLTFRMLEMGLRAGEIVKVLRYAPLGDPMHIRLKGYELSLRKRDAEKIEVEHITNRDV